MTGTGDIIVRNAGRTVSFPGTGPIGGEAMGSPTVIEDSAVLVLGGRIVYSGPEEGLWSRNDIPDDCPCLDAQGGAIVPGFVDPHTHAVFSGTREFELGMKIAGAKYLDILKAGGGILRTVRETRGSSVEDLVKGLDDRLDRMMTYGTTCAEVKTGYGLDERTELDMLRANRSSHHPVQMVPTFLGPHAGPPEYKEHPDRYIDLMISLLPRIKDEGLADFADIFCEKGVFDAAQSERFLTAARECGLGLKIHSDEIENLGGTIVGAALGAVSAEHLLVSTEDDMLAMKRAGTVPVLLPGTLLTIFEDRIPPVKRMMELNLPIAIATDLNPNCMLESMQTVQALACYRLRMTPYQALAASTVNAAFAIGLGHRKGRLSEGYDGDIVVLKDPSFDHVPYHFGVNHVRHVVIGGKVVVRDQGW